MLKGRSGRADKREIKYAVGIRQYDWMMRAVEWLGRIDGEGEVSQLYMIRRIGRWDI